MSVDDYLAQAGLAREYWKDPQLRVLVQLLLNLNKPASGPTEQFLSGTVIMTKLDQTTRDNDGHEVRGRGSADIDITSTGVVRDVASELLEAAITGRIAGLLLPPGPPRTP